MSELPVGVHINNLIDDLKIFSWEAGKILLYYSNLLKDSKYKRKILKNTNLSDPVTLADLKVNEIIINRINEKYKKIPWEILSEENAKISKYKIDLNTDWIWILDPLDGTKDFIQGTENYAFQLALNFKNTPYIGIVLIPNKDELWISYGNKVWCEKRNGSVMSPNLGIHKNLREMTLVTSKNHRNKALNMLLEKIGFKEVIVMGSIGCKIASIVRGESDIYICMSLPDQSSPKDWDFAAPEAILKASGGAITNLENEKLTYNKENFDQGGIIIASNDKRNHKRICLEIKKIIKDYNLYPSLDLV